MPASQRGPFQHTNVRNLLLTRGSPASHHAFSTPCMLMTMCKSFKWTHANFFQSHIQRLCSTRGPLCTTSTPVAGLRPFLRRYSYTAQAFGCFRSEGSHSRSRHSNTMPHARLFTASGCPRKPWPANRKACIRSKQAPLCIRSKQAPLNQIALTRTPLTCH